MGNFYYSREGTTINFTLQKIKRQLQISMVDLQHLKLNTVVNLILQKMNTHKLMVEFATG